MMNARRLLSAMAVTIATFVASVPAVAQEPFYKGRTISLVIGSNASGGYDGYGRLLARHMGRHIPGNPAFVVQNMPGANGVRAASHV